MEIKTMIADPKEIIIQCDTDKITINGAAIAFPFQMEELVKILGEPEQVYDAGWNVYWNKYGIYTNYWSSDYIPDLRILFSAEPEIKHLPEHPFTGKLYINGQYIAAPERHIFLLGRIQILSIKHKSVNDAYACMITKNYNFKEEISSYDQLKPIENFIDFKDFNFKLLVIEQLMFDSAILKPRFDVYEFISQYNKRQINVDEEGYEIIPEVAAYFENLQIDQCHAGTITELYQDGGNQIYGQLCPFWDGEDHIFDIQSYEDVNHFPNLKKMTIFSASPEIFDQLRSKGIQAEEL